MHPLDYLFRRGLPLGLLALLGVVSLVGWYTQSETFRAGYTPAQPIPFSHQQHAGSLGMACGYCHPGTGTSPVASLPSAELCLGCHRVTRTEAPAIQELARLAGAGLAPRWRRVYALPDHVRFDHRPHIRAGFDCQECHGDVRDQTVLERRVSFRMGVCLDCHRRPERPGPTHCSACHR